MDRSTHDAKFDGIFQYSGWLSRNYSIFRDEHVNIYHLINIHQDPAGKARVKIKVLNNDVYFDAYSLDIARNDEMILGFSRRDVRTITYLACEESFGEKSTVHKAEAEVRERGDFEKLTKREAECLVSMLAGNSAKKSANKFGISAKTVEGYLDNIREKLQCFNRTQIFEKAFAAGLIDVVPAEVLFDQS